MGAGTTAAGKAVKMDGTEKSCANQAVEEPLFFSEGGLPNRNLAFRASLPSGDIIISWCFNVWRELLLFYRNFGSMSPHFVELLHSYIILGPFELSRRETGEIAAVLQDSLSGEVRPYRIAVFLQDFAYGINVS
ncbi:hypothetical protein ABEX25_10915 [Paenibacillus thiaminolyticus]|uniref:hypothetical protein n=1 Tax=Paenibacillus thiaminolyticus TaxID=49283 RepID=UPI003D2A3389